MAKGIVRIDELVFDEKIYPRVKTSWYTANDYANSMRTGSKFPPITVAKLGNKTYLIDGWHRVEAYRLNGVEFVDAEVLKIKDRKQMYIESIKRNAIHGRPFSFQEKLIIASNLEKMRVSKSTISQLIGVTMDKMRKFKAERISYSTTGKPIVLKGAIKHLSGMKLSEQEEYTQEVISGYRTQERILDTVISMIRNDMFNTNNPKVVEKLDELKKVLKM